MKNEFGYIVGCFLVIISLSACEKKTVNDKEEDARNLFVESETLMRETMHQYISSNDSLVIDSIENAYEKKITEINFSYPPQTDLKLTEQENDSLFKLIEEMRQVKKERLFELSHQMRDSLIDSVQAQI